MILIISKRIKSAESLSLGFSYMGILSSSVHPSEVTREMDPRYRAAIVIAPEELADVRALLHLLRAPDPSIPVLAISDKMSDAGFSKTLPTGTTAAVMAASIKKLSRSLGAPPIGDYELAGLDLSPDNPEPTYYFTPFSLTATESMIARLLVKSYPATLSVKEILHHAFRPSRMPEPSSVRTHISSINKKFSGIFKKPLIKSVPGCGYIICTPEYRIPDENEELQFAIST